MSGHATIPLVTDDMLLNCMQCGFCLPHCPTYQFTPLEKYSPRGRIQATRALFESVHSLSDLVSDGSLSPEVISESLDSCLGCLACQTACPAGVEYEAIFEGAKDAIRQQRAATHRLSEMLHRLGLEVLLRPKVLSMLSTLFFVLRKSALPRNLPSQLQQVWELIPEFELTPYHYRRNPLHKDKTSRPNRDAKMPRDRVGLFTGCIMDVAFHRAHDASERLLNAVGLDVTIPQQGHCCGALHAHNGYLERGIAASHESLKIFDNEHLIAVNSAGCGAMLKHVSDRSPAHTYPQVKDLVEVLFERDFQPKRRLAHRVIYHDACHLQHGQGISEWPRALLKRVFDTVLELHSPECCGSAGIYNLLQPEWAQTLLEKKINAIASLPADYLVTGNPGCLLQLRAGVKKAGLSIQVIHTAEALAMGI